jgi:ribonuclease HII
MPWQIGIDEAGYGPNLGPFVMTLVACRVPNELAEANLWGPLKHCCRRADEDADHRLVVADSKQVYSPANGWLDLEKTVLAAQLKSTPTLQAMLEQVAPDELPLLRQEAWFGGDTLLPTEVNADDLANCGKSWRQTNESAQIAWGVCRSAIVPAPRFNDLIDRWDSKGAVLGIALTQLIEQCMRATTAEPMRFVIDKHGGRNTYSALLQHAFSDGNVWAEKEGSERSVYRVEGLDRPVRITFMPKADVEHFTVALASMVSKYVRELLMREFNRFWLTHVPDLKPTAGYPGDAVRFFEAIKPVLAKLGIAERAVWRSR